MEEKNRNSRRLQILIIVLVVVALAAISVPFYTRKVHTLRMNRVTSDFSYLARHLEEFKTDWGSYPVVSNGEYFGKNTDDVEITATLTIELSGSGTDLPYLNIPGGTSLTDRDGGIEYIEPGRILMLYNPFNSSQDYYYRTDESGSKWVLSLFLPDGKVLYRSNQMTTITEEDFAPIP